MEPSFAASTGRAAPFWPQPKDNQNFVAVLAGENEVFAGTPGPSDSRARGLAKFQLSQDGSALSYRLISSNIENVVQAHIHVAPVGINGPISVFLYGPVASSAGRTDGVLATGSITDASTFLNQGATGVTNLGQLVAATRAGNPYVNVHTNDGVAPTNTGPGDFPGGEIRGQIRPLGPPGP